MAKADDAVNVRAARAAAIAGKQLYQILGVSRWANSSEISRAYKAAAKIYHPDRVTDDEAKRAKHEEIFKQVSEACDILLDTEARKEYDIATLGGSIPDDLFSKIGSAFGSACETVKQKYRVEECHSVLNVTLRDIATGTTESVYSSELGRAIDIVVKPGALEGTRYKIESSGKSCVYTLKTEPHATLRRGGNGRYRSKDLITSADVALIDILTGEARGVVKDATGRDLSWGIKAPGFAHRILGAGLPDSDQTSLPGDLIIEFTVTNFPPKFIARASILPLFALQ